MTVDGRGQEAGQFGGGELLTGVSEQVGGGGPARAHHQGHVVSVHTGTFAQLVRGLLGGGLGRESHYGFSFIGAARAAGC